MIRFYVAICLLACFACEPRLDNSKCQIYIAHSLVALREQSDDLSQEMVKVPIGKYDVLDTQKSIDVRWLKIRVGKREGWIPDNTWTIEKKSDACK